MHSIWNYLAMLASISAVNADCCNPVKNCRTNFLGITTCYACGDDSMPTPYCGVGECNAFGCNCDHGKPFFHSYLIHTSVSSRKSSGCRGGVPGFRNTAKDNACSYDSTFESVSRGEDGVSLADYLTWATTLQDIAANNATSLDVWIETFAA